MSDFLKQQKQKEYNEYVKQVTPTHSLAANMAKAFLTGGAICVVGQGILNACQGLGMDQEAAGSWTSMLLVLLSVLLTGWNLYQKLAKFGGAGTLVPITGFRILSRPRRSSIRRKDRCSESAARFLRLQDRSSCTEFSRAGCLE